MRVHLTTAAPAQDAPPTDQELDKAFESIRDDLFRILPKGLLKLFKTKGEMEHRQEDHTKSLSVKSPDGLHLEMALSWWRGKWWLGVTLLIPDKDDRFDIVYRENDKSLDVLSSRVRSGLAQKIKKAQWLAKHAYVDNPLAKELLA